MSSIFYAIGDFFEIIFAMVPEALGNYMSTIFILVVIFHFFSCLDSLK